ncbi:Uncharacterized protein FWK35_00032825 [Aphis craccivora]|uniref:Uncharacterized protein n=1 Tax=Aphis craccivora TaxID=307492 RepID=A0A6G0VTQ4_APHCR|nr:Uncharacterized protein FWK35_00032825 [Aphis craccivora]
METHLAINLSNLSMSFVNKILDTSSGNDYRLRSNILNFEKDYVCHHSSFKKVDKDKNKKKSKNMNCPAKILSRRINMLNLSSVIFKIFWSSLQPFTPPWFFSNDFFEV